MFNFVYQHPWIMVVLYLVWVIELIFVFEKFHEEKLWKAIVPIWNLYTLYSYVWEGWICFFFMIPIVRWIVSYMMNVRLARKYGYSYGFAMGLVLCPVFFYFVLAFGEE